MVSFHSLHSIVALWQCTRVSITFRNRKIFAELIRFLIRSILGIAHFYWGMALPVVTAFRQFYYHRGGDTSIIWLHHCWSRNSWFSVGQSFECQCQCFGSFDRGWWCVRPVESSAAADNFSTKNECRLAIWNNGAIVFVKGLQWQCGGDWNFYHKTSGNEVILILLQKQNLPRGKGLGGSSQINYMLHFDGIARDFQEWKEHGLRLPFEERTVSSSGREPELTGHCLAEQHVCKSEVCPPEIWLLFEPLHN